MKSRFHTIQQLLLQAYQKKNFESIKSLAAEYLNLAPQYKSDWNYGNAIHQANFYLGLVAVEENKIEAAKEYLLKAAKTPGSPQLNTFGPNMLLAKRLLEKEETTVVLTYIEACKKFWSIWLRFFHIRRWKKEIKKGLIPNFGGNLIYYMDTTDTTEFT